MIWSIYPYRDSRLSNAAVDYAMSVSNFSLVAAALAGANCFEALQFAGRLVSSNGAEIARLSEAQHSAQAEAMRQHADRLFEFGRGIFVGATRPFRAHLITACCVIL